MSAKVFLNGQMVDEPNAHVSIHDAGLMHGVGLFETMRSYQGVVFRLADHLDRLFRSAETLGIEIDHNRAEIAEAVEDLLDANSLTEARIRLTVTRGSLAQLDADQPPKSTLILTAAKQESYPEEYYKKGMTVIISRYKQNPDDPLSGHKTLSFFSRMLALQEAQQKQAGEALMFTTTNRLAEGAISNVFLVKAGELLTPPLETPVLPGITRQVTLELAQGAEIEIEERELLIKDVLEADEIFLTNAIMGLMPVCRLEKHTIGNEKPGPVYQKLHDAYRQTIERETNEN